MDSIHKAFIFTSRKEGKVSKLIALLTCPPGWWFQLKNVPSHTGITFERLSGKAEYFETHHPDGWKGPKPIEKLERWKRKHPKRWVKYRELELTPKEAQDLYTICEDKLQDPDWMDYSEGQILAMFMNRVFKRPLGRSPQVVCHEAVAKVLFKFYDLRLWEGKAPRTFDALSPWWCQVVPLIRRSRQTD
jgi:hypothetical protein